MLLFNYFLELLLHLPQLDLEISFDLFTLSFEVSPLLVDLLLLNLPFSHFLRVLHHFFLDVLLLGFDLSLDSANTNLHVDYFIF